jgi:hypothetical protein
MAIQIIDGFQVNIASPIDNRIVASGSTARNAIPYKYHGLRVFDISNNIPYVWNGSSWISENSSGIVGSGTAEYIPLYTSSNVISNSLLYQYNGIIKTADNGNGADLAQIDPEYGTVYAQGGFYGPGSNITNISATNITAGTLPLSTLQGVSSNGQIIVAGPSSPAWTNQSQLSVGTASSSRFSLITNTSATNATHYLAFVSGDAWTSTTAATSSIRASSSDLSYNPSTKIVNATRINQNGGTLLGTATSKLNFVNLTSTTGLNTSNLEFNNVRNSTGTDWTSTGYRIQSKVDSFFLGYIQFNGSGNDTGISIGTGYQSDSTSNTNERFRINSYGDTVINSENPYTSDTLNVTNTSGSGIARMAIQANQPIITLRNAAGTEKWSIYRKSTDDNLTFYNGSVDKLVLQSGGTLRAAADNSSALGTTSFRFTNVCAVNGTIQTSDLREKKDIQTSNLGLEFITKLNPVSYKWKVGHNDVSSEEDGVDENGEVKYKQIITPIEGKRTHYGLIAQEVKEVLGDVDFGGFIHDDESDIMGLRYDQFISPLIKAIQEQQAQIEELKSKIK